MLSLLDLGYEIHGFDQIPDSGPALIVYYHGALPIDFYYLMANVILHKKRQIRAIGDRFLFRIPGTVKCMCVYVCMDLCLYIIMYVAVLQSYVHICAAPLQENSS